MTDLSLHIEQILRSHDSVAVPGLGAFFAEYLPARVDVTTSEILPPSRTVAFNSRAAQGDDRLVMSMMRRHCYSRATAIETIDAAVEAIKGAVSMTGHYMFGQLGEFAADASGEVGFRPSKVMPLSINPYGLLPRVPVTSVLAAARAEAGLSEASTTTDDAPAAPIFLPSRQSRRYWGRIAAMLAIIATFGIAFINGDGDRGHTRPSLAAIATYSGASQTKPLDCELYIAYPNADEATATVQPAVPEHRDGSTNTADIKPVDTNRRVYGLGASKTTASSATTPASTAQSSATTTQPAQKKATEKVAATSNGGKYALIIASLPSRDEARRFIAKDGNPNLEIIEADGRYRVAISRSDSRTTLEQQQPNVASQYKGAWIYSGK